MRKNIAVLILENNGKVLIEKRKKTRSTDPSKFVFPGGHTKDKESPENAIIREAKEELGIEIINPELIYTTDFNGPEEKQRLHFFWCNNFIGKIKNNEAEKHFWINVEESDRLSYQVSRNALKALKGRHEIK